MTESEDDLWIEDPDEREEKFGAWHMFAWIVRAIDSGRLC